MVCHAFVSITFAFSCYSRSVEARNCRSDRRETGTQIGQIGKSENPLIFFAKTENQMLKNGKSVNQNRENEVFWHKNRKTDLKNSQNRKTENPSAPLDKQETHTIKDISRISVHAQKRRSPPKKRPHLDHIVKQVPHLNKRPPTPPSS